MTAGGRAVAEHHGAAGDAGAGGGRAPGPGKTLAAAILAAIGVMGEWLTFIPEWVMLALFLLAFFFYGYCIKRAWRVARYIKRVKRRIRRSTGDKQVL